MDSNTISNKGIKFRETEPQKWHAMPWNTNTLTPNHY